MTDEKLIKFLDDAWDDIFDCEPKNRRQSYISRMKNLFRTRENRIAKLEEENKILKDTIYKIGQFVSTNALPTYIERGVIDLCKESVKGILANGTGQRNCTNCKHNDGGCRKHNQGRICNSPLYPHWEPSANGTGQASS